MESVSADTSTPDLCESVGEEADGVSHDIGLKSALEDLMVKRALLAGEKLEFFSKWEALDLFDVSE